MSETALKSAPKNEAASAPIVPQGTGLGPVSISVSNREAALAIASPEALAVCGVYWIVRRLCGGIQSGDENLQPVAEQMLAYFDMLS